MSASLSVSAVRPLVKHPAESILFGVDFRRLLASGELLTAPVSVSVEPSDLEIGPASINSTPFSNETAGTVPTGAGVQFRITGGTPDTNYRLTITVNTTRGNVRAGVCALQVRD